MLEFTRRQLLSSLAVACATGRTLRLVEPALAADECNREPTAADLLYDSAQQATDKGLQFPADRQQPDGSCGPGSYNRDVAVSALSGMAFMAGGSTPGRGPYGAETEICLKYVLDN